MLRGFRDLYSYDTPLRQTLRPSTVHLGPPPVTSHRRFDRSYDTHVRGEGPRFYFLPFGMETDPGEGSDPMISAAAFNANSDI